MMNDEAAMSTITVQVRLFASLRQAAGAARLTCGLPAGATVADLMQALAAEFPALPKAVGAILCLGQPGLRRPGDSLAVR